VNRFEGKVALVTGAASGIGRAVAIRLASEGASVACIDLNAEGAQATADDATSAGGTATAVGCDITDEASVAGAVGETVEGHGHLDVVCNVAGIGTFAISHEAPVEQWERIVAVNLTGTYIVCRATIPHLTEADDGVIVNTASNAGLQGVPYAAAYCASKGGVVQLTRALASEYLKGGPRIVAIAPGGVATPIHDTFQFPDAADPKAFRRLVTPRGMCTPEEVAGTFAYVASPEARYMTGSIVTIDGGLTI